MKATRFIYTALAVVASCGFATSCSDDDEPIDPRINNPFESVQFIEIDNQSYDWKNNITGGSIPLLFKKEGFKDYSTILTYGDGEYSYEVFIPATGAELNLTDSISYNWFKTFDYMLLDDVKVSMNEELLGTENESNEWYYFTKSNEYIQMIHTEPKKLDFKITPNTSKSQRKLSVKIWEDAPVAVNINLIFTQQRKQ